MRKKINIYLFIWSSSSYPLCMIPNEYLDKYEYKNIYYYHVNNNEIEKFIPIKY